MQVRDRSLPNAGGVLTRNRGNNGEPCEAGPINQAPRIPSERNYTEVSTVVGDVEQCAADIADQGGDVGEGHVSSPTDVGKSHGVATHPGLNRAHQMSSVSHTDHCAVHGAADKCEPMTKPGSNLPEGGSGMSEVTGEPESTVAVSPSSAGSTMPSGHGGLEVAKRDLLHAETGSVNIHWTEGSGVQDRSHENGVAGRELGIQGVARLAETVVEPGEGLLPKGPQALIPVHESADRHFSAYQPVAKAVKAMPVIFNNSDAARVVRTDLAAVQIQRASFGKTDRGVEAGPGSRAEVLTGQNADKVMRDENPPKPMMKPVDDGVMLPMNHPAVYTGPTGRLSNVVRAR